MSMTKEEFNRGLHDLSKNFNLKNFNLLFKSCSSEQRAILCDSILNSTSIFIPSESIPIFLSKIKESLNEASKENHITEDFIYGLFLKTEDIQSKKAIVKWCISDKIKLNEPMVAIIKKDDFLPIEKIKAMKPEKFDDLLGLLNEEHKDYFQAIRALGTQTNCPISFNVFIEILKRLKKPKTNKDLINLMNLIELTDSDNTPVELWRLNEIDEILQEPTLNNALFETLLKNANIKKALKDISSTSLEPASIELLTCSKLMAHVKTISDKQFNYLLFNWTPNDQGMDELFDHALGLNDKSIPEASIDRTHFLAYRLSCSLLTSQPQDLSLLIKAQQHQIQCLLSYLKKYPRKHQETEALTNIFKLAMEYRNCTNTEEKQGKLNAISTNTAYFVKKSQTTLTLAAHIANIVICLTVLPMFIFYLCSLFMNSKVFYSRENPMTEAVQQLAKKITALENIGGEVQDQTLNNTYEL